MYQMNLTAFEQTAIYGVLVVAILSLLYAWWLRRNVMAEDKGSEAMIRIWTAIKDGADAYLTQQLRTILPFIGVLIFVLFFSVLDRPAPARRPSRCSRKMRVSSLRSAARLLSSWVLPSR